MSARRSEALIVYEVVKLVREDYLGKFIGFAGISCLWLPTCVDEMGWGILVTAQDILVSK